LTALYRRGQIRAHLKTNTLNNEANGEAGEIREIGQSVKKEGNSGGTPTSIDWYW